MIDLTDGPSDGFTDDDIEALAMNASSYDGAKKTIKMAQDIKEAAQLEIQKIIGDREGVFIDGGMIKWGQVNYKAQPEKVTPAKEARVGRRFSVKVAS